MWYLHIAVLLTHTVTYRTSGDMYRPLETREGCSCQLVTIWLWRQLMNIDMAGRMWLQWLLGEDTLMALRRLWFIRSSEGAGGSTLCVCACVCVKGGGVSNWDGACYLKNSRKDFHNSSNRPLIEEAQSRRWALIFRADVTMGWMKSAQNFSKGGVHWSIHQR